MKILPQENTIHSKCTSQCFLPEWGVGGDTLGIRPDKNHFRREFAEHFDTGTGPYIPKTDFLEEIMCKF